MPLEDLPVNLLPIALDDVPMAGDNGVEVPGVDLADEDRKFMEYLAENGWEGEVGEDDETLDDSSSDGALEKQ